MSFLKEKLSIALFELAIVFSGVQIALALEKSFNLGAQSFLLALLIFVLAVIFKPSKK